jgi:hypothetical protein
MTQKPDQTSGPNISPPQTKRTFLEFFLVSYAPNASSEQSVDMAVVIVGDGFADVRFAPNWDRVLALDPDADTELLTTLTSEIRGNLQVADRREEMLRGMQDSWSNTIRVSPRKGCLTDDPATEIETLASQYLR